LVLSSKQFDPIAYKAAQLQEWEASAGGWKRWIDLIEQGMQPASDRMVELAGLRSGHRVLDVATGIGEPALSAARRVGAAGRVVATDQSRNMLAVAQERAVAQGLHNLEFRAMDAESLDLPENSFDAILCRFGLMFLPNLAAALMKMRRLLAPGGRLVAAVWAEPSKVPTISMVFGVVQQKLNLPPPPPGTPSPFSLADVRILEQALKEAGFAGVSNERVNLIAEMPSAKIFVDAMRDLAAPLRRILASQPPEVEAEVWQEIEKAAGRYADADGVVRMPSEAILVVATLN
jgi:SAM-dependent methyltransferase